MGIVIDFTGVTPEELEQAFDDPAAAGRGERARARAWTGLPQDADRDRWLSFVGLGIISVLDPLPRRQVRAQNSDPEPRPGRSTAFALVKAYDPVHCHADGILRRNRTRG